ncbi:MAG: PP2C family protein-serine/threonine phosphatase [Terriglobales bacterium]
MLGVFFIFSTIAFTNDIMDMGREPAFRFALSFFLSGAFAVSYAAAGFILRKQMWKAFLPLFAVQFFLMGTLAHLLPDTPQAIPMGASDIARLQSRLALNGVATIVAIGLGYGCFVYVSIVEGRRYFRVHAEMTLATEIHRVLVPVIDMKIGNFDFHGRSLPSGEVGGDLIDVFESNRGWIAYIADVSGHGVAPGVVMGMVKSAARMQLSSAETSAALLEHLNSVLYPIKKPEMFVTFAYLAWNGQRLEFSLAGHPPILHYHAATKNVSEIACSNLPLGMFSGQQFVTGSVQCARDDVFLLLTDGMLEVENTKDEEFGLAGVKSVFSGTASNLPITTLQAILDAAHLHGHAADDQSLLLVRSHVGIA